MMSGSCGTTLPTQSNIVMGPSPDYKVTGFETIKLGYLQSFCYSCTIQPLGSQSPITFTKDALQIQQYPDCSNSLVAKKVITFDELQYGPDSK